jgi:hypothetical protein
VRSCDIAGSAAVHADIEAAVVLPPQVSPAAVTTICTLTICLIAGEARDALEALPRSLHELFMPCERLKPESAEPFTREITRVVFAAAHRLMSPEERDTIARQLSRYLRTIWREPNLSEAV